MMQLSHISIVSIPVKDIEASKAFYTDKLGFAVKSDNPFGKTRWVEVAPEDGQTRVVLTTWFHDMSPVRGFVLETNDIDQAYATLIERGVETSDIESQPWGRFVTISDPDGNGWVIQQSTS